MLLQKLLSFCQSFIIRLLGCSGLLVLLGIFN
jgi:hypothetical protein